MRYLERCRILQSPDCLYREQNLAKVRNILQAYSIRQDAGETSVQKFQRCRIHTCAESSVGRIYMCRESSVVQNTCTSGQVLMFVPNLQVSRIYISVQSTCSFVHNI